MKKIFTSFSLALLLGTSLTAGAQTTITAASTFPPVGTQDSVFIALGISQGVAGNGVTWDFSSVSPTYAGYGVLVDPATTPYAATFPSATHAIELNPAGAATPVYDYYIVNSDGFYILASGYSTATPGDNYTPNTKLRVPFPFSYGNSVTDPFQKVGGSPDSYTITYDGFGTLVTPSRSINDVVRVKYVWTDGEVAYNWFTTSPLFYIATWSEDNGGRLTLLEGEAPTGIVQTTNTTFRVFPNPAKDMAWLQTTGAASHNTVCLLHDATGRLVRTIPVQENTTAIERGQLPAGLYFYEVQDASRNTARGVLVFE